MILATILIDATECRAALMPIVQVEVPASGGPGTDHLVVTTLRVHTEK